MADSARPTNYLTATETIGLVREGRLTISQLAEATLDRIAQRDDKIKAWAYLDRDGVLLQAKMLDEMPAEKRGMLYGCTFAVKDIFNTFGMPTRHNSLIYDDSQVDMDAAAVAIVRAEGALIIGKTHTTEFASTHDGPPTGNPYNTSHTPGGSSSGSAAAVADFQAQLAIGTQTGGSTLRPGSFCNIFAYKPTQSLVSREGMKLYSNTLDTAGFFARSPRDLELLAKVYRMFRPASTSIPPSVSDRPLEGLRLAFLRHPAWNIVFSDTRAPSPAPLKSALRTARALLVSAGAACHDLTLPPPFAHLNFHHTTILDAEAAVSFLPERLSSGSLLSNTIQTHFSAAASRPPRVLLDAQDEVAALRRRFDDIVGGYDAVVSPGVTGGAPKGTRWTGDGGLQKMFTLLHVPCVSVPGFLGEDGMPIGMTVVARRMGDKVLFALMGELARTWEAGGARGEEVAKVLEVPAGVRPYEI